MSESFCSLIVFGTGSPRTFKLHLSRRAIAILVVAFLLSFLAVVWVGFTYPPEINDLHRKSLEAENRELKAETTNAVIRIKQLNTKVSELEEKSKRVYAMVTPAS